MNWHFSVFSVLSGLNFFFAKARPRVRFSRAEHNALHETQLFATRGIFRPGHCHDPHASRNAWPPRGGSCGRRPNTVMQRP
jgi:hypothetical protein